MVKLTPVIEVLVVLGVLEMNRKELLETAENIVMGARTVNYGSPESNFQRIADLWNVYLGTELHPADIAIMMILMKIARLQNNIRHEDSWVDIAGYAANGAELVDDA